MGESGGSRKRDLCRFWQWIAPGVITGASSISGHIGTPGICGMHVQGSNNSIEKANLEGLLRKKKGVGEQGCHFWCIHTHYSDKLFHYERCNQGRRLKNGS